MGTIPDAIQKAAVVDEGLVHEHLGSRGYAMPSEKPALEEETRTLICLAVALGAWMMSDKLKAQQVKVLIGVVLLAIAAKMVWGLL
jgi:hypothetical protein